MSIKYKRYTCTNEIKIYNKTRDYKTTILLTPGNKEKPNISVSVQELMVDNKDILFQT